MPLCEVNMNTPYNDESFWLTADHGKTETDHRINKDKYICQFFKLTDAQ